MRVLVLGAYGAFGARAAQRLARASDFELIVAGRSRERAEHLARRLSEIGCANVAAACMDAADISADQLARHQVDLLINASGPYQRQDYRLAQACIAAGIHYVDLADARNFVAGIGVLNEAAERAGVLVVSGASTVPALSAAVVDAYAPRFAKLACVRIVISPGNSFNPGLATTQSILSTLGRPLAMPAHGAMVTVHGWQGLQRRHIPGLGNRWLGACDTPDLELFPRRYPGLRAVQVFAALEVGVFHLGQIGRASCRERVEVSVVGAA